MANTGALQPRRGVSVEVRRSLEGSSDRFHALRFHAGKQQAAKVQFGGTLPEAGSETQWPNLRLQRYQTQFGQGWEASASARPMVPIVDRSLSGAVASIKL